MQAADIDEAIRKTEASVSRMLWTTYAIEAVKGVVVAFILYTLAPAVGVTLTIAQAVGLTVLLAYVRPR